MSADGAPVRSRAKGADNAGTNKNREVEAVLGVPFRCCIDTTSVSELVCALVLRLTPTCVRRFQVRVPQTSEANPLRNQRAHRVESEGAPAVDDRSRPKHESAVALLTAVSCELEAPVESTEERKEHSSVGGLDAQSLVKDGDGYAWVNGGDGSCRGVSSMYV